LFDVTKLQEHFDLADMAAWAKQKDRGFDIGVTKDMVENMATDVAGLPISPKEFERMRTQLLAGLTGLEHR